jgi:hypothetical protein
MPANLLEMSMIPLVDGDGEVRAGAKLYAYETGTTTPLDTYSDSGLSVANANPVVADAAGQFGAIYLKAQAYKLVLKTAADVTVWTRDPVDPRASTTAAAALAGTVTTTGLSASAGVLKVDIDNLTAETTFDPANDKVMVFDDSANALRSFLGQYVQQPPMDYFSNLVVLRAGAATVDIDADFVVVENSSGSTYRSDSVNLTANLAASGANGLDTGSEANSTWYFIWVIYNGTTTASLLSTSATAPTMPSGYTHKALVGACYNDSGGDLDRFWQYGRRVFTEPIQIFTDTAGPASYTSQSLAAGIPTIARMAYGYGGNSSTSSIRHFVVAGDANGVGEQFIDGGSVGSEFVSIGSGCNFVVPLITAQTLYWKAFNTGANHHLVTTGWSF